MLDSIEIGYRIAVLAFLGAVAGVLATRLESSEQNRIRSLRLAEQTRSGSRRRRQAFEDLKPFSFTHRLVRPGEDIRWVQSTGTRLQRTAPSSGWPGLRST